ncbi:MAG: hypothetical protein ACRDJW_12730 [Thermomicrobiales bacterium]
MVASPSDVASERKSIPEFIYAWNAVHALDRRAILLPVMWETHVTPQMGDRPQALINKQILDDSDTLVGVFWTRLGTPTGREKSGTVEEIQEFRQQQKPVLLYFSTAPVILDSVDPAQYQQLSEFKRECRKQGIVFDYGSVAELGDLLHRHLLTTIRQLQASGSQTAAPESDERSEPSTAALLIAQIEPFLRRLEAEWAAERDSQPHSLDEGKSILQRASSELLDLRSHPAVALYPELGHALDGMLVDFRRLQRHRLYLDGGASYREFWTVGNDLLARMKGLPTILAHKSE